MVTPQHMVYDACIWKTKDEKQRQEELDRDILEILRGTNAVLLQAFDIPSGRKTPPPALELASQSSGDIRTFLCHAELYSLHR